MILGVIQICYGRYWGCSVLDEIWKDVVGWEGLYKVSNQGRVKSLERITIQKNGRVYHKKERILKPAGGDSTGGYLYVYLYQDGRGGENCAVHRLVAIAFIPNPDNKPEVNHKDGVRYNDWAYNLEWATSSENQMDVVRNGRKSQAKRVKCIQTGKIYDSMADSDRQHGWYESATADIIRNHRPYQGLDFELVN